MQNLIKILLLLIIISSCGDSSFTKQADISYDEENKFNLKTSDLNKAKFNQDSSDYYINKIAIKNEVHSEHIGFGGSESQIYIAYERLRDNLNIEDIFPLLKHDSTAVRIYSYYAIVEKDSTMSERAWKELKGKNDLVYNQSGCTGMNETIQNVIKGYH